MDRSCLLLFVLFALASCATGKGAGFSREASRERAAHAEDQNNKDTKKKNLPNGEQPQQMAPPPGTTTWTPPPETKTTPAIEVEVEPTLGTLELQGPVLEGVSYFLSGRTVTLGLNRVPVGNYQLWARRFGYYDLSIPVVITQNRRVSLTLKFDSAPFSLTGLRASRPRFNPESGPTASTTISFEVSGPGELLLVLTDSVGTERGRWPFHPETWHQQFVWNGRDGDPLPDGLYTFTVGGENVTEQRVGVVLDRSLLDRDWASLGPAPGLLWTPTPEVLSPGTLQITALALGHTEDGLVHAPVSASVRISPDRGWELFGQTSFRLWSESALNSGYATVAVKSLLPFGSSDFRLAWVLGGTLGSWLEGDAGVPPTDFLTTFPALRALLPASWSWGRWTILLAPEIDGSFWSPASAYQQAPEADEGFRFWGYGRFGLSYDAGTFSVGLSGVAKTTSFDRGAGWLAPASLGLETRYAVPQIPLTMSAYLSVSAYSTVDYAWYGGVGLSLLLPEALTPDMGSSWPNSP